MTRTRFNNLLRKRQILDMLLDHVQKLKKNLMYFKMLSRSVVLNRIVTEPFSAAEALGVPPISELEIYY